MNLYMHPEKGVNPRLSYCPQCGEENNELILVGIYNWKQICGSCGMTHYGPSSCKQNGIGICVSCKNILGKRIELTEHEKIPGGICSSCEAKNKATEEEVIQNGGIYWKCTTCQSAGAIKANHPLCMETRKHFESQRMEFDTGLSYVEPTNKVWRKCGIKLDKDECPVCNTIDK